MNKKVLFISVLTLVLVVGVGFYFLRSTANAPSQGQLDQSIQPKAQVSYKDATYVIDGQSVTLKNGYAETEVAPGSVSKIITRYFGNEVLHDLDADGREDVVFIITQETGGSGTFFYVVAALNKEDSYLGSKDAYLLGDRIAPQSSHMSQDPNHKDVVVINYADRASGEGFTVKPSIGKSVWLKFDPATMQFGIVVQDFEGESR